MRRSLAKGRPLLPEPGPMNDADAAERYRRGQRDAGNCSWCGRHTVLAVAVLRGVLCPTCDR